jgi:hypothetical protein
MWTRFVLEMLGDSDFPFHLQELFDVVQAAVPCHISAAMSYILTVTLG